MLICNNWEELIVHSNRFLPKKHVSVHAQDIVNNNWDQFESLDAALAHIYSFLKVIPGEHAEL